MCLFVCVCAVLLNTERLCDSLDKHCYKMCYRSHTHTHTHRDRATADFYYSCLAKRNTLLNHNAPSQRGTLLRLCACLNLYFSSHRCTFWSSSLDATSSQFEPKSANFCLYKYGFEKFTVQLCRLNTSHLFLRVCAALSYLNTAISSFPRAENHSFEGKKQKKQKCCRGTLKQIWSFVFKV